MEKPYTSNAQWPKEVSVGNEMNISTDDHETMEQACAICDRLQTHGFGGEGKVFPICVWVGRKKIPNATSIMVLAHSMGINPFNFLPKEKKNKIMGPGVGTNRMKRKKQGKEW